jgi:cellulose synthase/poly-beta-1,6-N-acetylglucosamine synthase-like glycosyltransferase
MQSLFINESRYKMGKSSFLNGTGFAIKKEVIDKHGFDPKTVTEDIEFTALCALNDEKIAFANDAITYDEQLTNFKSSLGQRKRWSFGAMECLRNYFPMLLKKGIKEKNFECIDVAIFYLSVIFHVMLSLVSIVMFFSVIINYDDFSLLYLIDYIIAFILSLLVGMLFRVFVLKRNNKSIKDNLGGILLFDLFVFSWIPVNLISIFMKTCSWDQIKHNRNIDIENI